MSLEYSRYQIQTEIIRCTRAARDQATISRDAYKARAKRMAKAEQTYFLQRATCDEIQAAANQLRRDMRDAPKTAGSHTPDEWQDARRFALAA